MRCTGVLRGWGVMAFRAASEPEASAAVVPFRAGALAALAAGDLAFFLAAVRGALAAGDLAAFRAGVAGFFRGDGRARGRGEAVGISPVAARAGSSVTRGGTGSGTSG